MGFHWCYGTWGGWPMKDMDDLGLCVRMTEEALARIDRRVDYVHMPALKHPQPEFFAPLAGLEEQDVDVYLGIIHHTDGVEGFTRAHGDGPSLPRPLRDRLGVRLWTRRPGRASPDPRGPPRLRRGAAYSGMSGSTTLERPRQRRSGAPPEPCANGAVLRVMLAGEPAEVAECSMEAIAAAVAGRSAIVTITVLPGKCRFARWAPLAGVPLDEIHAVAMAEACETARRAASELPDDLVVLHRVARSWDDVARIAYDQDVLIVAARPPRRRHRRACRRMGPVPAVSFVGESRPSRAQRRSSVDKGGR